MEGLLEEFAARGVVRLTGVFSDEDAALMCDVVWAALHERDGIDRADRATWPTAPQWKKLPAAKRHPCFQAVLGPPLRELADALLGTGWVTSAGLGNLLVGFPEAPEWHLPGADGQWHSDYGYATPMDPLPSLRVFMVFGPTPPGGGGTLLVAGSHRMVGTFIRNSPDDAARRAKVARVACHSSYPWLKDLTHGSGSDPGRVEQFMSTVTDVDGIPAQVIEACGEPGDVYVCHPWTIHCRPPNAGDQPRFLRAPTLSRRATQAL
jgi:hypothetical protein